MRKRLRSIGYTGYICGVHFSSIPLEKGEPRVAANIDDTPHWIKVSEFLDFQGLQLEYRETYIQRVGMAAFIRHSPAWAMQVDSLLTQSIATVLKEHGADKDVDCL